jgi:hypothetical protein
VLASREVLAAAALEEASGAASSATVEVAALCFPAAQACCCGVQDQTQGQPQIALFKLAKIPLQEDSCCMLSAAD